MCAYGTFRVRRVDPAMASRKLINDVQALGRLPRRKSKPVGDEEVAENNFAIRLSKAKAKNHFSEEEIAKDAREKIEKEKKRIDNIIVMKGIKTMQQ